MKWGYTLPDGKPVTNARSETAAEKPMFRDGMLNRRCLVPASNYFEWERRGRERVKYAIRPAGHPVLYMAGVYRMEGGRPVFAILTRAPAEPIAFIHDRMPVILPADAQAAWLDVRNDGARRPPIGADGHVLRHRVGVESPLPQWTKEMPRRLSCANAGRQKARTGFPDAKEEDCALYQCKFSGMRPKRRTDEWICF